MLPKRLSLDVSASLPNGKLIIVSILLFYHAVKTVLIIYIYIYIYFTFFFSPRTIYFFFFSIVYIMCSRDLD